MVASLLPQNEQIESTDMARKSKTNSAAKKRFKVTGKARIKRAKAFRRHLLTRKTTKRKRSLRKGAYVSPEDTRHIRKLLTLQ